MNEIKAIIRAKSLDYLLGYIDSMIAMKNNIGAQRVELFENSTVFQQDQNEILGPVYLDITCECGNYVAFKNANEIPSKSFKCPLCEGIYLIHYDNET